MDRSYQPLYALPVVLFVWFGSGMYITRDGKTINNYDHE
jgi:hypothetical protein